MSLSKSSSTATAGSAGLVGALAATTTVGYGVLFYAYGVLLLPMERDLGWSRTVLTGAFTSALLVCALLTIPVGRWLDGHAPRRLLTSGGAVASVLVGAWALVDHPVALFAVWIGLGGCMALLFYEPAFTILTKRLRGHERHRAVTKVTLVAGLATTIFSPLTAVLEDHLGWRGAVVVLALLLGGITVPLFAIALRPPTDHPEVVLEHTDTHPREAMRTVQFWLLTGAYLLTAFTTYAITVHLVPYLRGEGWTSGHAALALGSVGLVQVLGRSGFARLTLRRAAGPLGTWVLASKGVGIAAVIVSPTVGGVVVFLLLYGTANGLQTLTRATVIGDLYGAAHYGSISAVVSSVAAIAGATAPFAMSGAVALVGQDEPVLWGLVALAVASALLNHLAVTQTASVGWRSASTSAH